MSILLVRDLRNRKRAEGGEIDACDLCQAAEVSNHLGCTNVLVQVQPTKDILILSF